MLWAPELEDEEDELHTSLVRGDEERGTAIPDANNTHEAMTKRKRRWWRARIESDAAWSEALTSKNVALLLLLALAILLGILLAMTLAEQGRTSAQAAECVFRPPAGARADQNVTGRVFFERTPDGTRVRGEVFGVPPFGEKALHIHRFGAGRAQGLGPIYNPYNKPHGCPGSELEMRGRKVGDLGNILADADGRATVRFIDELVELNGKHSIIGRSVALMTGMDNCQTEPDGDSGFVLASCSIEVLDESGRL